MLFRDSAFSRSGSQHSVSLAWSCRKLPGYIRPLQRAARPQTQMRWLPVARSSRKGQNFHEEGRKRLRNGGGNGQISRAERQK